MIVRIASTLLLAVLLACVATKSYAAESGTSFIADLEELQEQLHARHANLYHATPEETFAATAGRLRARLPELDPGQAAVALAEYAALARDGHTAIFLLPFPGAEPIPGITQLPLQLYDFDDGLRIVAIHREQERALGSRIDAICGVPAEHARQRISRLVPRDNEMGEREYVAWYASLPQVLYWTGICRPGTLEFTLAETGETLRFNPPDTLPDAGWINRFITLPGPRDAWSGIGDGAPVPRWLSRTDEAWWFESLPGGHVYGQINRLRESGDDSFADFVDQMLAALPKESDARLILDLRLNRGGNGELRWPLVHALIRRSDLEPGRLFVITGRRTFSAAQLLANALERHTPAIFVGEPTGSSPNHHGELGHFTLTSSGLPVFVSTLFWQNHSRDDRRWITPDIPVTPTIDDLAAGRDPALERALRGAATPATDACADISCQPGPDPLRRIQ